MAFTENLSSFFPEFGINATWGSATVRGIYDNEHGEVFGLVSGSKPVFLCSDSDISGLNVGASITVNAIAYTVAEVKPDGHGLTLLVLETA